MRCLGPPLIVLAVIVFLGCSQGDEENKRRQEPCAKTEDNTVLYDLTELLAKPPCDRLTIPFKSPDGPAVFVARWPVTSFESPAGFVAFTERYDSAMQGCIQGMDGNELAEWFVPHEDIDVTETPASISPSRNEDAVDWINRNFPFVVIPWLSRGDHTEVYDEHQGEYGDLIAVGPAGYLMVFVADLL